LSARLESISSSFDDWVHERKGPSLIVLQEEVLENFVFAWRHQLASNYLQERGISQRVAADWDLRYCLKQKRIVFPVRDANSRLVGAVGRAIFSDTRPKYYNYFGFETGSTLGGLHRLTGQPRIGVCEGFFDAIRHWRLAQEHGFDFVCTFTSKTSKQQAELLLSRDANIYYFYDQDEAGESGWDLAKKRLGKLSYGLRRVVWADKTLDVGGSNTLQFKDILNGIVSTVETTTGTK
jgi:DNA primase